jgi:hypothetical protein
MTYKEKLGDNMIKKLSLKLIIVIGVAIIFLFLLKHSFFINGVEKANELFTKTEALTNTAMLIEILSGFFIVMGVIIAVWQYVLTSQSEISKYKNERIQKAIDLSAYYKDNILDKMAQIAFVYKKSGIHEILQTVEQNRMEVFDTHELKQLYTENNIDKIKKILDSDDFLSAVAYVNDRLGLNVPGQETIVIDSNSNEISKIKIDKFKTCDYFLNEIVIETLNNMEYFSMHFTHNTADDSVVYQSLHSSYIDITRLLYYNIAKKNETGHNKYFTNIIELYNLWVTKSNKQSQKELNSIRNNIAKGNTSKVLNAR